MKVKNVFKNILILGCVGMGITNTYLKYILVEKTKNLESNIKDLEGKMNNIIEDNKKNNTIIELLARNIKKNK